MLSIFSECEREYETSGYNYHYFPSMMNYVAFQAQATSDVHIALSPRPEDVDAMYEIVIGAGGNTFSAIRRCKLVRAFIF